MTLRFWRLPLHFDAAALQAFDAGVPGGIVIAHAHLHEAPAAALLRHFALDVGASERAAMAAAPRRDAKNPRSCRRRWR